MTSISRFPSSSEIFKIASTSLDHHRSSSSQELRLQDLNFHLLLGIFSRQTHAPLWILVVYVVIAQERCGITLLESGCADAGGFALGYSVFWYLSCMRHAFGEEEESPDTESREEKLVLGPGRRSQLVGVYFGGHFTTCNMPTQDQRA
jgi:hypothetical protein